MIFAQYSESDSIVLSTYLRKLFCSSAVTFFATFQVFGFDRSSDGTLNRTSQFLFSTAVNESMNSLNASEE
jgi:hypothetical protein